MAALFQQQLHTQTMIHMNMLAVFHFHVGFAQLPLAKLVLAICTTNKMPPVCAAQSSIA